MTDSIFPNRPESWPAFCADIINKLGFIGPFFLGPIILIIMCGSDAQKAILVDAVLFTHQNIIYSLVFWICFIATGVIYAIQRQNRKKSLQETIEKQELKLRDKDLLISRLTSEIKKSGSSPERLKKLETLLPKKDSL